MTTSANRAGNSFNCVGIGICNSKLFQKPRPVYRPLERSCNFEPSAARPPLPVRYSAVAYKYPPPVDPPMLRHHRPNVKRMRTRRDRARKASLTGEQQGSDMVIKLPDKSNDKEEEEVVNSGPGVARILLGICGILFVILGLGVLIYAVILVISSMTSQNFSEALNNRFKVEPVSTHKMTWQQWLEKRAKEQRV